MGYSSKFFESTNVLKKIGGVWVPKSNDSGVVKLLYLFYNLVALVTSLIFFICELLIFKTTIKELNKCIAHFGMLFTHIVCMTKFCIMLLKRRDFERIQKLLQDEQFEYESFGAFQPAQMFIRERGIFKIIAIVMMIFYSGVGVSGHVSAWVTLYYTDFTSEVFDGNTTCLDYLPYFSYVPFSTDTKSMCRYAFWFLDIPLDFLAWYSVAFDTTFVSILCSLQTHFVILSGAFKSIRERCLKRLGLPDDFEVIYDDDVPELERELYGEIRRCTVHLMTLLRVCEDVEDLFNFILLAQILASLMVFASCLFVASTVPLSSPGFFSQVEFFTAVLFQLSTFCWFGNEMTQACEAIRNGLYESDWLSASRRFKYCILLNMIRLQRPPYVSIGKFTSLELVTLVSVCRGSFSYFAVFKNVQ